MTHHDWFNDCDKLVLRGGSWASVDFCGVAVLDNGAVSTVWAARFTYEGIRSNETVLAYDRWQLVNAILTANEIKG